VSSRWKRRAIAFLEEDFQFSGEAKEGRSKSSESQYRHFAEGDTGISSRGWGCYFGGRK